MLLKNLLPRIFVFKLEGKEETLEDPNPAFTTQAVLNFYANNYPILTTAKIEGPTIEKDKIKYTFTTTLGTKG
nr:PRTRC system protein C [uncultured Pedobacter sp.]